MWATQEQIASIFDCSISNVSEHIKHVYENKELQEIDTFRNFRNVSNLTKEEGVELLKKVQEEFVINRGWHEMVLLPDEERAFNEYYKIKE